LGADSDDEDDPEFSKKLEKKLEHQRMLPMAKKVRVKNTESTLEEGEGELIQQEDDDWFLKDEVGSTVGDLPSAPSVKVRLLLLIILVANTVSSPLQRRNKRDNILPLVLRLGRLNSRRTVFKHACYEVSIV